MLIFLYCTLGVFGQKSHELLNHMVFAPKHGNFLYTQNFTWQFKMVLKRLQTHFSILFCTWCWKITIKPVRQPILKYCRKLSQDYPGS